MSRIIRGFNVDSVTDAPLQLTQYAYLEASHETVFATVSDHGSLHLFTRSIKRIDINASESNGEVGVGTTRFCHTPARMAIQERIVHWEAPYMYGYAIQNFQTLFPDHLGLVLTEPLKDGNTLLTWQSYFHGRVVTAYVARVMLGVILPDLVSNLAEHFGGRTLSSPDGFVVANAN